MDIRKLVIFLVMAVTLAESTGKLSLVRYIICMLIYFMPLGTIAAPYFGCHLIGT